MGEFVRVAGAADVSPGTIKGFKVGAYKIAVANAGGKLYAFEDRCSHQGKPLSDGLLLGSMVMCIAHGAQFDLETGRPITIMTHVPIRVFTVKVEGDDILVEF